MITKKYHFKFIKDGTSGPGKAKTGPSPVEVRELFHNKKTSTLAKLEAGHASSAGSSIILTGFQQESINFQKK